jgi:Zn finger protein HypA/HybF involved in hydrogenase expression
MHRLERQRVQRAKLKAIGICVDCRDSNKPLEGHVVCEDCRSERLEREERRQLRLARQEYLERREIVNA